MRRKNGHIKKKRNPNVKAAPMAAPIPAPIPPIVVVPVGHKCDRHRSYFAMLRATPDLYTVGFRCPDCGRSWDETLSAAEAFRVSGRKQCASGCGRWYKPFAMFCVVCLRQRIRSDDATVCIDGKAHRWQYDGDHDCPGPDVAPPWENLK